MRLRPRDAEQGRLLNRSPIATHGPWTGLIIADLFAISGESPASLTGSPPRPSRSEEVVRAAKVSYAEEQVIGSDAKDHFCEPTVAGAQIDFCEASAGLLGPRRPAG